MTSTSEYLAEHGFDPLGQAPVAPLSDAEIDALNDSDTAAGFDRPGASYTGVFVGRLMATIRRLRAAAPVWQPIETAPINKIVYIAWAGTGRTNKGRCSMPDRWFDVSGHGSDGVSEMFTTPTHWMPIQPLPSPPNVEVPR